MDVNIAANWIAAFSATASAIAALAAWKTVKASGRATEAQILLHLRTEFSSQPMHDALRLISQFKEKMGGDYVNEFRQLKDDDAPEFHELNNARRLIKGYYLKVYHLSQEGIIGDAVIRSLISNVQFDFMLGMLEPLEKVIAVGDYDNYLFQWASNIR